MLDALRRHPTAADGLLAVGLAGFGTLYLWIAEGFPDVEAFNLTQATILIVANAAPLTWRRRYPMSVFVALTAIGILAFFHGGPDPFVSAFGFFLGIYGAGAYGGRHRTWLRIVGVLAVAAMLLYDFMTGARPAGIDDARFLGLQVFQVANYLAYLGAAWLFGNSVRARRQREADLTQRNAELEAAQQRLAEQAVLDERVRIARELHDVVAHHVSVMGVQAGAARLQASRDPAGAAEALRAVEDASRSAVTELHRLLGFLRAGGDRRAPGGPAAPQPTLSDLDVLVEQVRRGDLAVTVRVDGTPRRLPPVVELSAYRVVQEALTNVLKHAGPGAAAEVRLAYQAGVLDVRVDDDGRGRSWTPSPSGRGLLGMRERVALHGGTLEVGPRPGGGWSVAARLPVAA